MNDFLANDVIFGDMKTIEADMNWDWLNNKTVLITGASGMLASYCVFFLIYLNETHSNMNIRIIANGRNPRKIENRFGGYSKKRYFNILAENIDMPIDIKWNVDYVIHAAGLASPQYYSVDPIGTLLPNAIGTYYLLQMAKERKNKGFLFFSSSDVYGQLPEESSEYKEDHFGEIDPMALRSCYAESKRIGETMCKAFSSQYGLRACAVRISHTYGPTLNLKNDERLFAEFVKNIVSEEDIQMKSDGSAIRSFCYISDAVRAFFRILKDGTAGEAYNMCNSECWISVKELAEMLVSLFPEKNLKVVQVERGAESSYIESSVKKVPAFNTDKLKALGWNPNVSLKDGFSRTILSFQK